MAVKIRLQRFGGKKRPYYRIVTANSRAKRDGRYLEQVGTYDPMRKPHAITFRSERMEYWISVGAQCTDTVASLYRKYKREDSKS